MTMKTVIQAVAAALLIGSFALEAAAQPAPSSPASSQLPAPAHKSVHIRRTDNPPRIDGTIEPLWSFADSVTGFIQNQPYERTEPSERTVVYLLQDDDNLYVAFRCHSLKRPPTANLTKDEDYVTVGIDPFGSKTTGYFFTVYGSGLFWDGLILDDGRDQDMTWEGVWSRAVRIYPNRMEVEMKIPFKTIRYKKGLSEWGLQFRRHIASVFEDDYWTDVTQKEGDLVSRWGEAQEIDPRSSGYYFELYPEGFLRRDDFRGRAKAQTKPKGSMNLKWDLTPQTSLNATAYPDFAQIESDPYTVNLSRYPVYLEEQRPFFVEGMEIFRLSGFPNSGFFQPLNIFYSRRIGKSLDGEAVPIVGGAKVTHKTADWDLGALAAHTDSYRDAEDRIDEPQRDFGVLRAKRRILGNSDIGVLAAGMSRNRHDRNGAIGLDGVFRSGANQLIVQGGLSDHNGKTGLAVSSGYRGFLFERFLTMATYEAIDDSFDVQDIGFVPWAGRQRVMLISGPYWTFRAGPLREFFAGAGILRIRDPGSPRWSTLADIELNPSLRRNGGCNLEVNFGRNYELDDRNLRYVGYTYRAASFNFWSVIMGNSLNGGLNYNYSFNYRRGYLADQGAGWLNMNYSIIPPLSVSLNVNGSMEWDPQDRVVATWPILRPRLNWRINPYMTATLFNEMVGFASEAHLSRTRLQSDRIGFLYSWNFAPKSWMYIALNDYSALDDTRDPPGPMTHQYSIGALKLKYLLYF